MSERCFRGNKRNIQVLLPEDHGEKGAEELLKRVRLGRERLECEGVDDQGIEILKELRF